MKLKELTALLSCKDGDELFEKVTGLLWKLGITATYYNGDVKDLYRICCEVADVLKKHT